MNMAARAGLRRIRLRHEREAHARRFGDLLQALLENDVPVPHLERFGVAHVELVLAVAPFAFRRLDRHARVLEVPAGEGVEALGARALQDVIVLEIPAGGLEVLIALLRGVAIAGAEKIVLELGGCERLEVQLARRVYLPPQDRARRDGDELVRLLILDVADDKRRLLEPACA